MQKRSKTKLPSNGSANGGARGRSMAARGLVAGFGVTTAGEDPEKQPMAAPPTLAPVSDARKSISGTKK